MRRQSFFSFLTLACVLLYGPAPRVQAQNSATPHQHAAASPMIDGAVHPELIPDSVAYRLYFITVSMTLNPIEEDRKRQQAHLAKIGLQDSDREILVGILTEFRTKYDILVDQYNHSAEAAAGRNEVPDIGSFFRQLDGLVRSTRDTLKLRSTPMAMTQLDGFMQSEKKHMKVQTEGQ